MEPRKIKQMIENKVSRPDRQIHYNSKDETLRIENEGSGKGITLSLSGLTGRFEKDSEKALDEISHYVNETLAAMKKTYRLKNNEDNIFPVIRSTSFPVKTDDGSELLYEEHTAETRVFFAIDLDKTYRLIDRKLAEDEGFDLSEIWELARFNLKRLPVEMKKDTVAGNTFYFLNHNDGYDASRILNSTLLNQMEKEAKGELAVATPHQDVLIFADIENKMGYDILGQMTMNFFAAGNIPVTSLPFLCEDGRLEPIFILAKTRPTD